MSGRLTVASIGGWRTAAEVETRRAANDVVIIDCPPHAETDARVAMRAADLVLVPVQPSPLDLWATRLTLDLAVEGEAPGPAGAEPRPRPRSPDGDHDHPPRRVSGARLQEYRRQPRRSSPIPWPPASPSWRPAPASTASDEITALAKDIWSRSTVESRGLRSYPGSSQQRTDLGNAGDHMVRMRRQRSRARAGAGERRRW